MKRSLILISILIIVLGVVGYFSYRHVFLQEKVDIFSLVPENSLFVYESNDVGEDWKNLQEQQLWKNLKDIPALRKTSKDLHLLDSLLGTGGIESFFDERQFVVSMHTISKDEFDFLYITELPSIGDQKRLSGIIEQLNAAEPLSIETHQFNGFEIKELRKKGKQETFTYIFYKNFFIGSFATLLVEDAIRNINADFTTSFLPKKRNAENLSGTNINAGKLYVNLKQMGDMFSIFSAGPGKERNIINSFADVALLEINLKEGDLLLNGFSEATHSTDKTWLETFTGLAPARLGMADIIPERTAFFHHMTFDNAEKWNENLLQYWKAQNPRQIENRDKLVEDFGINPDELFSHIGNEVGLATLESLEISTPDKLVYIHTSNPDEALFSFENIAFQTNNAAGDTVYKEEYSGTTITEIASSQFPSQLFGSLFEGFETVFYTPYDDYIVIGNSVEVLKGLLDDIEREDTWGKSVKHNQFLAKAITESNYSLAINISRVWNIFLKGLSPKWRNFMEINSPAIKSLALVEFQFSNIENDFYTSVTYSHKPSDERNNEPQRLKRVHTAYLENKLISKPFVFKNATKGMEVIVQDSAHQIYLLSAEGQILWKDSIDGQIVGDVTQIDFYKDGNLKLLFSTDKSLYVIDRDGEDIPGFPLTPGYRIDQVNVIDYNKSKDYRFLLADDSGNIYMYDKNGDNLEGWTPRSMDYRLTIPPSHMRVRARDVIFALEERGVLKSMTRRGGLYPGFPLSLDDRVISPLFLEIGSGFTQTKFTALTFNGMIIQGNFEGEIIRKSQLYKPSAAATFKLIPSSSGKTFLILRQDSRRVAILNKNGEILFEKDYLSSDEMDAQYFSFSSEKNFIAITDRSQDFTYLYDLEGNLINDQPLESSNKIEMFYLEDDAEYRLYSVYGSEFTLNSF